MADESKHGTTSRNAAVDGAAALRNGGTIQIWEGVAGTTPPATPEASISDDNTNYKLLATLSYGATAFAAAASGSATANAITSDTNAAKSGTAEFFRELSSGAVCVGQGNAGEAAGTPALVFDSADIVAGGTVAISSLTLSIPVS